MTILSILIDNDRRAFRSWFSTQMASKVFVMAGFLAVFASVAWFIYYGSAYFFHLLSPLQIYGVMTAQYIIKGAVLMIFFLGTGSAIASASGLFFSGNKNINYLLTLPVNPGIIVRWLYFKSILVNTLFLTVFLVPALLAFYSVFGGQAPWVFALKSVLLIGMMAAITNSIGGITALIIAKKIKTHKTTVAMIGTVLFVLLFMAMFMLLFPPKIEQLTTATSDQFMAIYNSLPLASPLVPSNWLAMTVTDNTIWPAILSLILTGIITGVFLKLAEANILLIHSEQAAAIQVKMGVTKNPASMKFEKLSIADNLAIKDLLSVTRSPAETGYGIFLLLLVSLFFVLFSRLKITEGIDPDWIKRLTVFSYAGFIFFANTYLLRIVFPLMAKESDSAWYLFTQPIAKTKILWSKLLAAVTAGLPLLLLSLLVWWLPAYITPYQTVLALSSFWTILLFIIIHTLMGTTFPNFSEGESPEKVSTSSMGVAALVITTGIALLFAIGIQGYIGHTVCLSNLIALHVIFSTVVVMILYPISSHMLEGYEF